jgi:Protein of unknown function (DUF3995)
LTQARTSVKLHTPPYGKEAVMNLWLLEASLCFVALAVAHSWLGERKLMRPLLAEPWKVVGLPRQVTDPLLRGAWHLTSLAWLAAAVILGAAAAGMPVPRLVLDALAALALVSGLTIFIGLRGVHAAWAVFAAAALTAWVGTHGGPSPLGVSLAGAIAVVTLGAISALHVYWVAGGRWGIDVAVPTRRTGARTFKPSAALTIAVALALLGTAAVLAAASGLVPSPRWAPWPNWLRHLSLAAAVVFGLRMVGDFRFAGLFKRERTTAFARWDSLLFSPLCGALCVACAIASAGR